MCNQSYHELEEHPRLTSETLQEASMQVDILEHTSHLLLGTKWRGEAAFHSTLDSNKSLSVILTLVTAGPALLTSFGGLHKTVNHKSGFNRAFLMLKDEGANRLEGALGIGPANLEEAHKIWYHLQDWSLEQIVDACENLANSRELNDIVNQLKVPLTPEGGILVQAIIEDKPFNITADSLESDVDKNIAGILKSDAFVVVPLRAKEEVIGVIIADNLFTGRRITDADIRLLSILAAHTAVAVENARLYQRLKEQLEITEQMQDRLLVLERRIASGDLFSSLKRYCDENVYR